MNYNQDNITKAWFFASKAHKEQKYPKEQLPYLTHIGNVMMEVMRVSSELKNAELAIICAILHDTIEDTKITYDEIVQSFSVGVADGVMALTKRDSFETKKEKMWDSLQRIKQQPSEIWVVKMADRIANLGEPPLYWNRKKIEAYQEEAKMILNHLGSANETMAKRLNKKIELYSSFISNV